MAVNNFTENFTADVSLGIFRNNIHSCFCCFNGLLEIFQWTQTSLKRHQDVLKRSRRLATKQDVVTTSGKRCRIYNVLKTSDLRPLEDVQLGRLEDVWFLMSWGRWIFDVLKTSDLSRLEDIQFRTSWGRLIYNIKARFTSSWRRLICDALRMPDLRPLEDARSTWPWRLPIYDVLKTSLKRRLLSNVIATSMQRRKKWFFLISYCLKHSEVFLFRLVFRYDIS